MATASIKAIDGESVHRIHAGQVVLELQAAIKELVENSLDAGATIIDVRIKDYGLESIEVVDNGSGISEKDWESIGLKHHTSKLPSLSHLPLVTTFGFRGEALSSLCALCDTVTVITATKETAPMGAIIKLGRDGRITDSSGRIARQRGITITLTGLFVPLPVRRKEFERTAKREFAKALTLLTGYALVPASVSSLEGRNGVRLKVESIGAGKAGKRNTVLATDGKGSLRSSVTSVWGSKALEGILDVNLELEVEVDKVMARREGLEESSQKIHLVGLISSASRGQGRSSADRQFFYINGRPCNLPKVAKVINEVYKTFNTHQFPLAILDFLIPPESVDINVSPDKRTILIHSETNLIEAVRSGLDTFFQPSRSSFAISGASNVVKLTQSDIRGKQTFLMMDDVAEEVVETSEVPMEDAVEHDLQNQSTDLAVEDEAAEVDELEEEGEEEDDFAEPQISRKSTLTRPNRSVLSTSSSSLISQPIASSSRTRSVPISQTSQPEASTSQTRSFPISSVNASDSRRKIQQTLDTTVASWSPERKSHSKRAMPSSSFSTQVETVFTGKVARKGLRERLAVYASQSGPVVEAGADDDDDDNADEDDGEELGEGEEGEDQDMPDDTIFGTEAAEDVSRDDVNPEHSDHEVVEQPSPKVRGPQDSQIIDDVDVEMVDVADSIPLQTTSYSKRPASAGSPSTTDEYEIQESEPLETQTPVTLLKNSSSSYRDEIKGSANLGESTLRFNLPRLRTRYEARRARRKPETKISKNAYSILSEGGVTLAAGISNRDMAAAEDALSRVISKADFGLMEVIGQFNKGFIIARLRSDDNMLREGKSTTDDLFIVDQHASDEKYNFETLQTSTVIKAQKLIKPRALQLTSSDEIVAMENLDVLKTNGFEVKVDEEKPPGRGERISLLAMPVSKETTFDFKDLEQLLHLLSDGSRPAGQMVRCNKARTMFASRACRKSVMIGKSLTKGQMVQLLKNMGTIDQPWNCPHGRPTMRHLIKIEKPNKSRSEAERIDWAKFELQD